MDPVTAAAVVGGGSSLLSSGIGAYSAYDTNRRNADLNREQMAFNAQQSAIDRDFQERMSSTAWQRATADMKSAGINPMLAFSQGGASSPSGGAASSGSLKAREPIPSPIAGVLTSALDTVRTMADASKAREAVNLMDAEKRKTAGETANLGLLGALIQARTGSALSMSRIMDAELPGRKAGSTLKTLGADKSWFERKFPRAFGAYDSIMDRLLPLIHSGADASRAQSYSRWADRW